MTVAPGQLGFTGLPSQLLFGKIIDPNVGPDSPSNDLRDAHIGTLFCSRIDGSLWSKVAASDAGLNPYGVWVSRT